MTYSHCSIVCSFMSVRILYFYKYLPNWYGAMWRWLINVSDDYKNWEMLALLVCLVVILEGNNFGEFCLLGKSNDLLDKI